MTHLSIPANCALSATDTATRTTLAATCVWPIQCHTVDYTAVTQRETASLPVLLLVLIASAHTHIISG